MDLLLNCAGRGGEAEEEYFYQRGRAAAGAPRVKLRRSKSLGKGPRASSKSQWQAPSASRVVQSMLDEVTMLREENLRLRREKEYNRASLVFNPDQERALAANLGLKWSPPAPAPAPRPDSLALSGTTASEAALHYAVGNVGSRGAASQRAAATSQLYATPHRTACTPSSSASQQRHGQVYATAHSSLAGTPQQRGGPGPGHPIYATPYASTVTSPGHSRSPSTVSSVTSPRSSMILTSQRSSLVLASQSPRAGTPPCTPPRRDLPPIPHSRSSGMLRGEEARAPRELPHVPVPQISMPSTLGSQCSGWSDDSGFREAGDSVNTSHHETLDHCARKGQSPRGSGAGTPRQGLSRSQSMKSPTASASPGSKSLVQGRPESVCVRRRISMGISGMRSAEKAGSARNSLCEAAGGSSGAGSPVETIPKQLEALTELIDELTLASTGQPGTGGGGGGGSETRGKTSSSSSSQEELKRCLGSVLAPQLADLSRQFHVYQEEQKVRHERLVSGQQRIVELTLQSKTKVTAVQNDLMKLISQGRDRTRDHGISEDVSMLPEYITGVGLAIQDKFGIRERVGDFFRQLMNPGVVDYICLQQQELSPRALFWRLLCELSRLLQRESKVVSLISLLTACEACKISPLKCKLMPRRHQAVIDVKYSYLVDNMVVGEVLPYLHNSGLLTSELQGYVMEGAVEKGRVARLISVLPVLGDQAFPLLLSALVASEQSFIEQELREELSRQVEEEERTQQAALARSVQNSLMAQSPDGSGQTVLSRLAGVLETSGGGGGGGGSEAPSAAASTPGASPLAIWQILAALRASIKDLQAVCLQNSESLALLHQERSQQHSPDTRLHNLYGSDVI